MDVRGVAIHTMSKKKKRTTNISEMLMYNYAILICVAKSKTHAIKFEHQFVDVITHLTTWALSALSFDRNQPQLKSF